MLGGMAGHRPWREVAEEKMRRDHPAVIEGDDATGFSAFVPSLPGCVAAGSTREEVERLIAEAIPFHLEGLRRREQDLAEDPAFRERLQSITDREKEVLDRLAE